MNKLQRSVFQEKTALIVVQEPVMTSIIETTLQTFGLADLYKVASAEEAIINLENYHIDIIISDQKLPELSGNELLQQVRTTPTTAMIPFIMVSSSIDHKDVAYAISQGVSDYLVKPFTAKTLEKKLHHALTKPVKNRYMLHSKESLDRSLVQKKQLTILIVDDIADNFKIISSILRQDYKVKAANNSMKALKICESDSPPDLILLDIMMPGMDGLEFCRLLKKNPFLSHISVIFTTALDDTKHIVKGLELGAVDYITKPINAAILKARVKTHCKVIHQQNSLRNQVEIMLTEAKIRADFESLIRHDLQRPISEMKKSLKIIQNYSQQQYDSKLAFATLTQSAEMLSQTVDNMQSLYKIEYESLPLNQSVCSLNEVAKEVLFTFGLTIKERHLKTSFKQEHWAINADNALLRSAVAKIFEFCINFAEDNSEIDIHINKINKQCQLQITVQHIMASVDKQSLLGSLQLGHDCDLNALLLYSAKRLIELHQGSLTSSWQSEQDLSFLLTFNHLVD